MWYNFRIVEVLIETEKRENHMLQTLLKDEARKRGLSSRKLAEEIGTSHTTIIRAMRGESIDLDTLIAIADWAGVRPADLLNSLSKRGGNMADQLAVLIERVPALKKPLEEAMKAIEAGTADPAIVEDIVTYATYKLEKSGATRAKRK